MLVMLGLIAKAQWVALPGFILPTSGWNWPGTNTGIHDQYLSSNGSILYTSAFYYSPSSGYAYFIQLTNNDMSTMQVVFSWEVGPSFGTTSSVTNLSSSEPNTYSWIANNYSNELQLMKISPPSITGLHVFSNGKGIATCITENFVYGIFQKDSMQTYRSNKAGSSHIRNANVQYQAVTDKLQFLNDSTGFTIAIYNSNLSKTTLLKTSNSGVTWNPCLTDSIDPIVDYHLLPSGIMYLCKASGQVYFSNNSGTTWSVQTPAPAGNYSAIRFMNDSAGYIGGTSGILFKTSDYGNSWTSEKSNTSQTINRLYTFGNSAYFVNSSNEIYKNKALLPIGLNVNLYPNPFTESITIECPVGQTSGQIKVYNLLGASICEMQINQEETVINLPGPAQSMYLIAVTTKAGTVYRKIIKK